MPRVVFTNEAIDDLRRLGPSVAARVLKKILLLEQDSEAGRPLGGELVTFRKLVVGDRNWRVVYRVDETGDVEVCEIWAAGVRSDNEIYDEAARRLAKAAEAVPELVPFQGVVERLGRRAQHIQPTETETGDESVPSWLAEKLIGVVGLSAVEVAALSATDAFDRWNDYITGAL